MNTEQSMAEPANSETLYEIEIRFQVATPAAAFARLPFLQESLGPEKSWSTAIFGKEIYNAGKLLRIGHVPPTGNRRTYLGYKEVDEGTFANIRREWGEEITGGVVASPILRGLGITDALPTPQAVHDRLVAAGHHPFMSFSGVDQQGYVPALRVHTKLMRCPQILGDAVMVELEQTATTKDAALRAEAALQQLAEEHNLTAELIRAEPPTLLHRATFAR